MTGAVTPHNYVPQDQLSVWALVNPARPMLVGELRLSQLVADCATFAYAPQWWNFALSEDLPLVQGQEFTAGERASAPGAIDDARPDRWGERIIRHVDRPARLSILEMLLFAGDDRFGALGVSVSADQYIPRQLGPYPQLRDLAQLSAAMEDLQTQAPVTAAMQRLIQPGVTLGGARPKALLQTDAGACVIKFSELDDAVDTPLVEHATMTLAAKAGIRVAATGVLPIPARHGRARHALTIERFDRVGDYRLHCMSARTALRAARLPESYSALATVLLRLGHPDRQGAQREEQTWSNCTPASTGMPCVRKGRRFSELESARAWQQPLTPPRTITGVTVPAPDLPVNEPTTAAPHECQGQRLRRIAHLDMDAFFASVELLRYPQLKGLPVVIGGGRRKVDELLLQNPDGSGPREPCFIPVEDFPLLKDYVGRGVITTATYPARQFGVGSAMGMMKAARLCPQAIVLPVDFDEVRRFSRLFKSTIMEIAPVMQDRGVDEVYIDFTDVPGGQREGGRVLARLIQKSIFDRTGLTCSIGVAPNRLLAKMASEFNKPNGISIVYEEDLQGKIWPLNVRKINGIGPKAGEKLARLGIETIGQLAAQDAQWLMGHFGKSTGAWMHRVAWGRDDSPVVTESEPVSMSRETTFDRDLHAVRDRAELSAIFTDLCQRVAEDLQRKGYVARTIGIKLRYDDFRIATRDHTANTYTADGATIRHLAGQCLKRVPLDKRLRLLGVRASGLVRKGDEPAPEHGPSQSGKAGRTRRGATQVMDSPQLF